MIKDAQKDVWKSDTRKSWKDGLEMVTIWITPAAKAKLAQIAEKTGVSVSYAASAVFQEQLEKYEKLEETIRETVAKSFDEEYGHLEENIRAIMSPIGKSNQIIFDLLPLLKDKITKKSSN
jgi:hypothetical protein